MDTDVKTPREKIDYLTVPQVAKTLDRSWLTVYNWLFGTVNLTPLPYSLVHHGAKAVRYRISEKELLDWLEANQPALKSVWVDKRNERVGPISGESGQAGQERAA